MLHLPVLLSSGVSLVRILTLLALPLLMAANPPAPPADFASPQSPPKPAPFPIEYVDQGKFDPKLKGLFAPLGFQVEIVADAPQVINPVGMHFAPDGTLFVSEWAIDPVTGNRWFEFKETFRIGTVPRNSSPPCGSSRPTRSRTSLKPDSC